MKKISLILVSLLMIMGVSANAQSGIHPSNKPNSESNGAFDKSGYFDYSKVSNLPFLKLERYSLKDDDESIFYKDDKLRKKYNNIMRSIVNAKNVREQKLANIQALLFLEELTKTSKYAGLGNYQLGHYYAFGVFDPYFIESIPSNIYRAENIFIDKLKAETYFRKNEGAKSIREHYFDDAKSYLQMIPGTWMSNMNEGLENCLIENVSNKYTKNAFYFCVLKYNCSFDIYELGKKCVFPCSVCKKNVSFCMDNLLYLLYYAKFLPPYHSMRKSLHEEMTDKEIIEFAEQAKSKNDFYTTIFCYTLSTLRGNVNSFYSLVKEWESVYYYHNMMEHPSFIKQGGIYYELSLWSWILSSSCEDLGLSSCKKVADVLDEYYDELGDEEEKAYKKEKRKKFWTNLGKFALQLAGQAVTTLSQMDAMNHSSGSSVNNAPLLSMSNSQFAAKNQQELNALMLKSRNDVNAQYWNEYQQFATYNKKPDGSNYSFDEWMALQGQAIQNLKNEGYDILAENQKIIDQQKADFEAERKADKEAWFEKMGYGKPSSTAYTNSTSNTTSSTISAKDDKVKTSQTVENSTNENLDSKQQYHTDAVSSDDYKYEKKVSLYIRDGNTNREMFSNKDLCKKDATYYVKLDNKYYRVESGSNWGFNSYIMYSSKRLMFNK